MSKIELKFGRPVIAWDDDENDFMKGIFINRDNSDSDSNFPYLVLTDGKLEPDWFEHVKPDLSAPPMNGDEVEGTPKDCLTETILGTYVGIDKNDDHVIDNRSFGLVVCVSVRHPQPSKRERVKEAVMRRKAYSQDVVFDDEFVDEILKITEVEE